MKLRQYGKEPLFIAVVHGGPGVRGSVAPVAKESRITNKRRIARYVARYIWHPAVANTRLHRYDGKTVTFWYKDHEGKRHFVTREVQEFIRALVQHIPD